MDLTFLNITFNATFHPAASAQTRGTHISNVAALLVGLGHLPSSIMIKWQILAQTQAISRFCPDLPKQMQ